MEKPLFGVYEVTSDCNYDCSMCYNVWKNQGIKKPEDLSLEDKLKVVDTISEICKKVVFTGGEPTLDSNLGLLISRANERGLESSLITNASILTFDQIKELKQRGLSFIEFSFLSPSEKTYNIITGTRRNHRIMARNCDYSLEIFGPENVMANMVILPENYEEVYQSGKLLNQKGIKIFATGTPIFSGKSPELANSDYILMVRKTYEQLKILNKEFGMTTYLGGCIPFCVFEGVDRDFPVVMNKGCEAGGKVLAIGSDGSVRPCIEYPLSIGNILNDKFEIIWNHPLLEQLRNHQFASTYCSNCENVISCKGGCRVSAMNNSNRIDPYLDRLKK